MIKINIVVASRFVFIFARKKKFPLSEKIWHQIDFDDDDDDNNNNNNNDDGGGGDDDDGGGDDDDDDVIRPRPFLTLLHRMNSSSSPLAGADLMLSLDW